MPFFFVKYGEFVLIFEFINMVACKNFLFYSLVAQHFKSSGMTLNERFGIYQRKAAEMEMMKPRKSPEIHR